LHNALLRCKRWSMPDLGNSNSYIQALRRKFEALLEASRKKAPRDRKLSAHRKKQPVEVMAFGANPGNLRMLVHIPERLPSLAPLVVALHGCSQTADDYANGTGWSSLADRLGFAVVYPEQQPLNNPKNCFSWFVPDDIARGHGEALSIRQMVEHAIVTFGVDRRRVFVTGLSAGGAMAAVMLATYPEVFAGGAIIAGLPYGCARSVQQALEAMFTEQSNSQQNLGDCVRAASKHGGPWPKISVWHGTADPIVKPSNAENITQQWVNVHGLSTIPSLEELIGIHTRRVWNDANGDAMIEAFSVGGMAHGVPLASTTNEDSCGVPGAFFLDAGISSTHHIANFWRLGEGICVTSSAAAIVSEPNQIRTEGPALVAGGEAAGALSDLDEGSFGVSEEQDAGRSFDPNFVIAAAFKAAGLPLTELSVRSPRPMPLVAPGPIIEAALKAAGLMPN
jgi:poly(hydroxyalkanoate) depolymerase family esterase